MLSGIRILQAAGTVVKFTVVMQLMILVMSVASTQSAYIDMPMGWHVADSPYFSPSGQIKEDILDEYLNPYEDFMNPLDKRNKDYRRFVRRPIQLSDYALTRQPAWNRQFLFGKRSSDEPVYFTKRAAEPELDDTEKRARFKFGKRTSDDDDVTLHDVNEDVEKRRKFLFGKRGSDDDIEGSKRLFKFGKKSEGVDDKRYFKFGKKSSNDDDEAEVDKRKMFLFGKKSDPFEDEKRAKFLFGKRDDNDGLLDAEKRRIFQFGKRYDGDVFDKRRGKFTFGKRPERDEWTKRAKFLLGKRPRFLFGKRSEGDSEAASVAAEEGMNKRFYRPVPYSFTAPHSSPAIRESSHVINASPRAIKTFAFGKRSTNSEEWQSQLEREEAEDDGQSDGR